REPLLTRRHPRLRDARDSSATDAISDAPTLIHAAPLLFAPCSARPQLVHSLPTRRSSDLVTRLFRAAMKRLEFVSHAQTRARRTDRKSTRLNSSHSQISYAVFCWKKKNIWFADSFACCYWIGSNRMGYCPAGSYFVWSLRV